MTATLRLAPVAARTPAEAAELSSALLARAALGEPWHAASLVTATCVALGARQRAAAVTTFPTLVRRRTTGPAAWIDGRALWCALALPDLDALYPDATPATLLNRNVRPWLRGLTRSGIPAAYLGRETVAASRHPVALLGYERSPAGALLLEMIVGWDAPIALPDAHAAPGERALDRWRARPAVTPDPALDPWTALRALGSAVAERASGAVACEAPVEAPWTPRDEPTTARAVEVPIGRVEAGRGGGGALWLGGDALVATPWLDALAAALDAGGPWPTEGRTVHGARPEDWARAAEGI